MKRLVSETGKKLENPEREGFHHIGHSTHWIVFQGIRILTDPWLSEPAYLTLAHSTSPSPLPSNPEVILISHSHGDHFDEKALERLNQDAEVLVGTNKMAHKIRTLGFRKVHKVVTGESSLLECGLLIDVVLGKHDIFEVCYRVEKNGSAFFFGGDSMITPEIIALAKNKKAPFVVLPGERSSLLGIRFVMTPEEAVSLALEFGARRAALSHHETFVESRWPIGWMISVPPPKKIDFPDWFTIPRPGDFIPSPWELL